MTTVETPTSRCGTDASYQAHDERGESPCGPCKDAYRTANAKYAPKRVRSGQEPPRPAVVSAPRKRGRDVFNKRYHAEPEAFDHDTVIGAALAIKAYVPDKAERFAVAAMLGLREPA